MTGVQTCALPISLGTSAGSISPRTKWQELAKYEFELPSVEEQRLIVEIMDSADRVREGIRNVNTSRLRRALWLELVTSNNQSGEKLKIGDILSLEYGKALKQTNRNGGSIPVLGSSGVVGYHDTPLVDAQSVIVIGRKGSAGEVVWVDGPCWPIDTAYYVRMKRTDVQLKFAFELLKQVDLPRMSTQTAVPGLNRDVVYSADFVLPGDPFRELYLMRIRALDDVDERLINAQLSASEALASLRRLTVERSVLSVQ